MVCHGLKAVTLSKMRNDSITWEKFVNLWGLCKSKINTKDNFDKIKYLGGHVDVRIRANAYSSL